MKKYIFGFVASIAFSASAIAADITPTNWTGLYLGGNLGYGLTTSSFNHLEGGAATGQSFTNRPKGMLGGVQTGARYQFQSKFVVGAELSYDLQNSKDRTLTNLNDSPRYRESKVGNIWSASANAGYAVDEYLMYIKAGVAGTDLGYSNDRVSTGAVLGKSSANVNGFVLGSGLEHRINEKFSVGGEYNYYKFNITDQTQLTTAGALAGAINASNNLSENLFLLKLNYNFN